MATVKIRNVSFIYNALEKAKQAKHLSVQLDSSGVSGK